MTRLIVIDESGDLGKNGTSAFVMAALVVNRSRALSKAYKAIPKGNFENKFYYATSKERVKVISEMADTDVNIMYLYVEKEKWTGPYGNDLYKIILEELLRHALAAIP